MSLFSLDTIWGVFGGMIALDYICNKYNQQNNNFIPKGSTQMDKSKTFKLESICETSALLVAKATGWFKLLNLDRREIKVQMSILRKELESNNILSLANLDIDDNIWHHIVKKYLIDEMIIFFNNISEYWLETLPLISGNPWRLDHLRVTIYDSRNRIHFAIVDFLNENQQYSIAIRNIYFRYKQCEEKNTNDILINYLCNDVSEIVIQYCIDNDNNHLTGFDKVINNHSIYWNTPNRSAYQLDRL